MPKSYISQKLSGDTVSIQTDIKTTRIFYFQSVYKEYTEIIGIFQK